MRHLLIDPRSFNPFTATSVGKTAVTPKSATELLTQRTGSEEITYQASWLDRNKTLLYVGGGLAVFGALFLFFKRKSTSVAGYRRRRSRR
jgi:hypothetical protein